MWIAAAEHEFDWSKAVYFGYPIVYLQHSWANMSSFTLKAQKGAARRPCVLNQLQFYELYTHLKTWTKTFQLQVFTFKRYFQTGNRHGQFLIKKNLPHIKASQPCQSCETTCKSLTAFHAKIIVSAKYYIHQSDEINF